MALMVDKVTYGLTPSGYADISSMAEELAAEL